MEKDFRLASRKFFLSRLATQEGKAGLGSGCAQLGGELLTQTEYIVSRWKEHFEEHLNPTSTSSEEEAES